MPSILTNNEQFNIICGNVKPSLNIIKHTNSWETRTHTACLQCDGYTKLYTQWYMSYEGFTQTTGDGNTSADDLPIYVDGIENEPFDVFISYTTPNINNTDELFQKEYEITQVIGNIKGRGRTKFHIFCHKDDVHNLCDKIVNDIGMFELTYLQKLKTYLCAPITPIWSILNIVYPIITCPLYMICCECYPYVRYIDDVIDDIHAKNSIKKRVIVLTKTVMPTSKLACCDNFIYSQTYNGTYLILDDQVEKYELLLRLEPWRQVISPYGEDINIKEAQQNALMNNEPDEKLRSKELLRIQNIKWTLHPDLIAHNKLISNNFNKNGDTPDVDDSTIER